MVFNSFEFLIFFPIVLVLYYLLPERPRWIMLLAASYYFYMSWNADLIFLILFTTAVSYVSAILIEKERKKHPDKPKSASAKFWLILTLVVSLGVLFFFKYFNFFSRTVADVISLFTLKPSDPVVLDLILPVGISFYTFQTLSYVIDVYRGSLPAERHFGYYALYVSFFPQLVAGPIERPENLLPQLRVRKKLTRENAEGGLKKMLIGFFKKVVVADLLATYVAAVYNDPETANGPAVLIATVLFAFQIYCDFSGYTDIAIGCAQLMGIRLMQNFDRPYTAESIKEFWRRWHISLSSWFRDYIYFPLGGSRCGTFRKNLNVCIVFLVSGLWHGADMAFVFWGALHGLYQVIGGFTEKPRQRMWQALHIDPRGRFVRTLRRFNTFLLVCFGWIFFRAASVPNMRSFAAVKILLTKLFTDWGAGSFGAALELCGLTLPAILTTVLSLLVLQRLDATGMNLSSPEPSGLPVRTAEPARFAYAVWAVALAWLLLLAGDGASSFIYFQF